jgi:hypothetical protein
MTKPIFITVVAVLGSGCFSVTQTARHARVPVVLGPVTCVGCTPRPAPAAAVGAPSLQDSSAVWSYAYTVLKTTVSGWGSVASKLDLKTYEARDPCHQEVVLRDVEASAWGTYFLFGYYAKASVEVTGDQVRVPAGSCDPYLQRWPLVGPLGIHWPLPPPPQPAWSPGAAPAAPLPPPPPTVPGNGGQP